jgi:hypothetical protein
MQLPSFFLVIGLSLVAGCSWSEPRLDAPSLDPTEAGELALAAYDANNDGAIAGAELDQSPGLKAALPQVDTDGDQRITASEVEARVQRYVDDRVALTPVICQVKLNGQPLSDASVKLLPEKFLGDAVRPAEGTTDSNGLCSLRIPGEEFPGCNCGIYRVEVSKKNPAGQELLPARYNSRTTLGGDVGLGSPLLEAGLNLNLSTP